MNVSLTPELEAFVNHKVESGLYQTASEVVREGLRLLRERDELRREVALGLEEGERGRVAPLNPRETLKRVRKARAAQRRKGG